MSRARIVLLGLLIVTILFSSTIFPYIQIIRAQETDQATNPALESTSCSYNESTSFVAEVKSDTCFQSQTTKALSTSFQFSGVSLSLLPISVAIAATTVSPAGNVTGLTFLSELTHIMNVRIPSSLLESPGPYPYYFAVILQVNNSLFPSLASTICDVFCWVGLTSQAKLAPLTELTWPDASSYIVFLLAVQSSKSQLSAFIPYLKEANGDVASAIKGLVTENELTFEALNAAVQFLLSEFNVVMYYSTNNAFVKAIDLATLLNESVRLLSDVVGLIISIITVDVLGILGSVVDLIDMFLGVLLPSNSSLLDTLNMVLTYVDPPINLTVRNVRTGAIILSPTQTMNNETGSNGLLLYGQNGFLMILYGRGKNQYNITLQASGSYVPYFLRITGANGNTVTSAGMLSPHQTTGGIVTTTNGSAGFKPSSSSSAGPGKSGTPWVSIPKQPPSPAPAPHPGG